MKMIRIERPISVGRFAASDEWQAIRADVIRAIQKVKCLSEAKTYPVARWKKERIKGDTPVKRALLGLLLKKGWKAPLVITIGKPIELDAAPPCSFGLVALEYVANDTSYCHQVLNTIALGLLKGIATGGIVIIATHEFYKSLTNRTGMIADVLGCLDFWRSIPCRAGVLEIMFVEPD